MAMRFRTPQPWTPQPDRDRPFGQRPQDTLNRIIPGQQGLKGTMAGLGQANSFKPRQGSVKRVQPIQPQQAQTATPRTATPNGVRMTFAGDPTQLAETFQRLVNGTGQVTPQTTGPISDPVFDPGPLAPSPIDRPETTPVAGPQPITTMPVGPVPGTETAPPPETAPAPAPAPAISTPESEFGSLQDYLNAVGRVDLIDENAYQAYSNWTPQLPQYAQQKIALDNSLTAQLTQAIGNQETAKAMQKLVISRLIEDEMEEQSYNNELSAARGLSNSSIKTDSSKRINKSFMREASTGYTNLLSDLMGYGSGLSSSYGNYLSDIVGLSSDEAKALYDAGLGGGGTVTDTGTGKGGKGQTKKGTVGKGRTRALPDEARKNPRKWLAEHPNWARNHPAWAKKLLEGKA